MDGWMDGRVRQQRQKKHLERDTQTERERDPPAAPAEAPILAGFGTTKAPVTAPRPALKVRTACLEWQSQRIAEPSRLAVTMPAPSSVKAMDDTAPAWPSRAAL